MQATDFSISRLFGFCGPATVSRLVVPIIVREAVNGIGWTWTTPHICEEVIKRFYPTVAYTNSKTTIIFIICGLWILAATLHAMPSPIFRAPVAFRRLAMCSMGTRFFDTATTSSTAFFKMRGHCFTLIPAITRAHENTHCDSIAYFTELFNNNKLTESLTNKIEGGSAHGFNCS